MAAQPRGWRALERVPEALTAIFDRRVGGVPEDQGRAAGVVELFALVSILSTLGYTVTYEARLVGGAGVLVPLNIGVIALFVVALVAARRRHQLLAAVIYLAVTTAAVIYMASLFGWGSGHHLYLITGAQLVFLMFTDRQVAWRWLFVTVSAAAFLWCQLGAPAVGPLAQPQSLRVTTMFAFNAVSTATLMFVLSVVAHYRAGQARAQVAALAERAEYLANTDALTGLSNRRPIAARLDQLTSEGGYTVALLDIDRFKVLNDTYGHACGDRVLAGLAARMRDSLRTTDALGRWGGEEFIFVLPVTGVADASTMMERMRSLVKDTPIACDGHEHTVTVSVGVAAGRAGAPGHLAIKRADDALYEAKLAGRDLVVCAGEPHDAGDESPSRPRRAR